MVDPPLLPGWDSVPLRDALAEATGLSVLVDKDVTSAAVAETWAGGPSGAGSFIFMYMGTGIGCGIVLNDEVVRGTSGTPARSATSSSTLTALPATAGCAAA